MSKIAEIVKVKGGYANFVKLLTALQEDTENTDRMAMYRPTKAHRVRWSGFAVASFCPTTRSSTY